MKLYQSQYKLPHLSQRSLCLIYFFDMQVIAIAIGKYQRVKEGVKYKESMCKFVLELVLGVCLS